MDAVLFSPQPLYGFADKESSIWLVAMFSAPTAAIAFSINGIVKLEIPISRVSPCFGFQQRLHKLFNRDFIVW